MQSVFIFFSSIETLPRVNSILFNHADFLKGLQPSFVRAFFRLSPDRMTEGAEEAAGRLPKFSNVYGSLENVGLPL